MVVWSLISLCNIYIEDLINDCDAEAVKLFPMIFGVLVDGSIDIRIISITVMFHACPDSGSTLSDILFSTCPAVQ